MDWNGRAAIVTGGASGIGLATVREFALGGAQAAIFDINGAAAEQQAEGLRAEGLNVRSYAVDVADAGACSAAAAEFAGAAGRIDFLVNNAASFLSRGLDATREEWDLSLGVNVRGCANMVQAVVGPMRAQGGAIVNLASISGHIAQPNRWTYNACKGAILAMTRCQALDLAPRGIRVNSVSPGWTWTPEVARAADGDRAKWEPIWARFSMQRRLGESREIARAILFLCSDDASFITGAELPVDGGYLGLGSEGLGETASFAS